jgi:hypothetical protein
MADRESIEQTLTDFYQRSRVAMSGPIPRWEPARGTVIKQGWGRQLLFAGAAAVFILAVVAGARVLRQQQSPAARPQPAPPPGAFSGTCKLPVSYPDDTSGQMIGGFLSFPGGSYGADSSASGLNRPAGADWISYDTTMRRWVPVDRQMVSPNGTTWVYSTQAGNENHAVNIRTGHDTTLWGAARGFRVFGLDDSYAYANSAGGQLWRLPLDGSKASQIDVSGNWLFVNGGAVWGTSAILPAGASFSLQRLDLRTGTGTTWVLLPTPATVVGFDKDGAPIVQVGGAGGDVIVAPSPGVQRPVAHNFYFGKGTIGIAHLPALGDTHGIWLFAQDGTYLSVNGVPSKQASFPAFLAGPCS